MKPCLLAAIFLIGFMDAAQGSEQKCLAEAIYFEARDQGPLGMLAVGVVIQNRVDHPNYPDTVCTWYAGRGRGDPEPGRPSKLP